MPPSVILNTPTPSQCDELLDFINRASDHGIASPKVRVWFMILFIYPHAQALDIVGTYCGPNFSILESLDADLETFLKFS